MILKKKTMKKNPIRKLISYFTEFRLDIDLNNFVRKVCTSMINENDEGGGGGRRGGELKCYRHTDRHTYRPSDEAGPSGAS